MDTLTSHVDILPTLLGLGGIDANKAMEKLEKNHTEVHPLVGRDLTPLIKGDNKNIRENEPIYFMTDDDPSKTLNSLNPIGGSFKPVVQPSHIETIIVKLSTGQNGEPEIWKYSRYFDNPQFWTSPGSEDEFTIQECMPKSPDDTECCLCKTTVKTVPVPDEIEMYNLTRDPIESNNLANPEFSTPESRIIQALLKTLLEEQCKKKRIYPSSGSVPGRPSCKTSDPVFFNL